MHEARKATWLESFLHGQEINPIPRNCIKNTHNSTCVVCQECPSTRHTSLPDKKTFPEVTLYDMRSLTERAQFYGALAVLVHCSQIPGVTNCQCTKACQEASVLRTIQKAFWAALKPRDNAEQWTQGAFRKGIILSQSHLRQDRRAEVQRSPWSDASFENAGLNMVD